MNDGIQLYINLLDETYRRGNSAIAHELDEERIEAYQMLSPSDRIEARNYFNSNPPYRHWSTKNGTEAQV